MEKLGITLDTVETGPQINQITEDPDITTLKRRFRKLFNENHTVNGIEVKNTAKRGRQTDPAEGKTNTDSPTTIGWKRNKQTHKTGVHRKSK